MMRISTGKTSANGTTPPTNCAACQHAEQTAFEQFLCMLAILWCGKCKHTSMFGNFSGLLGGESKYDMHRRHWIDDGEIAELTRMLRHVG
jgi:hypothetical protein